jgi:hypothetical protein
MTDEATAAIRVLCLGGLTRGDSSLERHCKSPADQSHPPLRS